MMRAMLSNINSVARLEVAVNKVANRLLEPRGRQAEAAEAWASARLMDWRDAAERLDGGVWSDAVEFGARLEEEASAILSEQSVPLGGGGAFPLLYFLVRFLRPDVVVETGVAAGWSSRAILEALDVNEMGELWSSDFPYIRNPQPERSIGCLVPEELRTRWHLRVEGDRRNLPAILESCGQIDLFHYDSDKSYRGRAWALSRVMPRLRESALIMMDDIQDNLFFADLVQERGWAYAVLPFHGKYVGLASREAIPLLTSSPPSPDPR